MSTLYVVGTPIGNLHDASARALDVLRSVDLILCEDTRVTARLLEHYQIKTPTLSYHQHSKLKKIECIVQFLKEGKDLALVSDAGTPGISDPGSKLIEKIIGEGLASVKITPVPGPSALIAAASVAGFPMDKFLFLGFPPAKKKRKKFFEEAASSRYPVIFYESPYRIIKTLKELQKLLMYGDRHKSTTLVVCRELTKKFETIYRGAIDDVIKSIEGDKIKGEFVVIVKP